MKARLAIGFVLVFLCVIPVFANALEITPEPEYPIRDRIIVPRLLIFKANLHLQEDEVWIKLWVMNHARQEHTFLIGCKIPCIPSWGHPHSRVLLEPHEKFTFWWKVRPCEAGWRTTLVPVYIRVWATYPEELVYSGDFTLEIPENWDYTVTAW